MIEIKDKKIYIGDFHTHWYWDKENPTLFIAGMYYLGYDFVLLAGDYEEYERMDKFCKLYEIPFRVFPGREIATEKAHIVCWVDKEFEENIDKVPKESPYKFLKENTKLVILAHPGENWADTFEGKTYTPLLKLYERKLIDAIQPQSHASYKIFEENGIKISVFGGFDIHACKPFLRYPSYLFKKSFHPFKHITPCSKYATIVLAEENEEKEIIKAVKDARAVSFDIITYEFIGDKEIIKFLKENNFIKLWKEEVKKRNQIEIEGNLVIGEKSKFNIKNGNVKYILIPQNSLFQPVKTKKSEIKLTQILDRENFYIPVSIKADTTYFKGLLAKLPLSLNIFPVVKKKENKYIPFVEINLKNRTQNRKRLEIEIQFEEMKEVKKIELNKVKKILFPSQIRNLTDEYVFSINLKGSGFDFKKDMRISFPVCKYTGDPWKIDKETSIKIKKENIYHVENWKGENDFSGEMNLYWDKENFYIYAEIVDDTFYQKWTNWETFWGDSIQFAFGPVLKKLDAYGFNYELIISKTKNGNEIFVWNEYGKIKQVRKLLKKGWLDVIRDEKNKKTIYKMKLPWKYLKPFKPAEGKRFLFSVIIFDNDGVIMERKWFFYGENIAVRKSMKDAHSVTLVK